MFEQLLKTVLGDVRAAGKKTLDLTKGFVGAGGAGPNALQAQGFFRDPSSRTGWSYQSNLGNVARGVDKPVGYERVLGADRRHAAGFDPAVWGSSPEVARARFLMRSSGPASVPVVTPRHPTSRKSSPGPKEMHWGDLVDPLLALSFLLPWGLPARGAGMLGSRGLTAARPAGKTLARKGADLAKDVQRASGEQLRKIVATGGTKPKTVGKPSAPKKPSTGSGTKPKVTKKPPVSKKPSTGSGTKPKVTKKPSAPKKPSASGGKKPKVTKKPPVSKKPSASGGKKPAAAKKPSKPKKPSTSSGTKPKVTKKPSKPKKPPTGR